MRFRSVWPLAARSAVRPPLPAPLRGGGAQDAAGGGRAAIFEAGDVPLQSGAVFRDVRIAYEVHGEMNADKSNVILHPTSFGAQSEDLRYRIGPGPDYTLDTSSYCVVIVNLLGNGLSSSPSHLRDGKGSMRDYPMPTMYDNVVLHERLLREVLNVDAPLALIFGYSMGAMAALHFAALFPDKVARVAAVCGAAKTSHYNRIFLASLRVALCADEAWDEKENHFSRRPARGLRAFGTIYAGWGLSPAFYREEEFLREDVGDFKDLADFLQRGYVAGFEGGEGHDLLAMLHTWDTGDISAHPRFHGDMKAALGSIRATTYLMPCETDRYFTVEDLRREAALYAPGVAHLRPIPSSWGHRAGDPHRAGQTDQHSYICGQVRHLLAQPSPLQNGA
eukprot:Tamp_18528.p1 GENE.Tamp_18528~~Tamp_18528.p1  ORF type:complete len:426 (+),score=68.94 Tamp_18528:104-1279(+)